MKEALPDISLADSIFKCFKLNKRDVIFYFDSWDNKNIEITFSEVVKLKYEIGDFISNICELPLDECAKKTIRRINEPSPLSENYKLFHIIDVEDFPVFEILAEKIFVLKMDKFIHE